MFDFQAPARRRRPAALDWGDPPTTSGVPARLAAVAAVVVFAAALLALDEGSQFDPAVERARLVPALDAARRERAEVAARKDRLLALDRRADTDPGVIHAEWLPPAWQLPVTFDTVADWQAAARRRVRRADEEFAALADREARLLAELAALPPPEARRVSLARRLLAHLLGDLDPRPED